MKFFSMNKVPFDFLILDLDDTLYPEKDFVMSGFNYLVSYYSKNKNNKEISFQIFNKWREGSDAIKYLFELVGIDDPPMTEAINLYRSHLPNILLSDSTKKFLQIIDGLNIKLGLVTDGRSVTQRNKLRALGIEKKFEKIIISEEFGSEKPNLRNFKIFENDYPNSNFCFIGDNTSKDFKSPSCLGWKTFCLKDAGFNIHKQNFKELPKSTSIIVNLNDIFVE
jgi:putative hydrolase of the HAD superfamily